MKFLKIDYRNYVCILITIVFLLLSVFYFRYGYIRIGESLVDLFNSCKFYIFKIFKFNIKGELSINNFSDVPYSLPWNLPNNWNEFKILCSKYFNEFFVFENLKLFLLKIFDILYYSSSIVLGLIILCVGLLFIYKKKIRKVNNNYNVDSKSLIYFKWIENNALIPFRVWVLRLIDFIKKNSIYSKIWLLIWCYNFNFFVIFIEFIAYYIYFISSFNVFSIYIQIIKLLYDLSPMLYFIPNFIWIVLLCFLFDYYNKKNAYRKQRILESRNQNFIQNRSLVILSVGTMGASKTASITDMALSTEFIFRNKALQFLLDIDLEFPNFPWINLELDLIRAIKRHSVYSLATCSRYVNSKYRRYNRQNNFKQKQRTLFGYDFLKYGMFYNDGLKNINLFDEIEDYCKCYLIYITESSLIISNYSIRTNGNIYSLGNFPYWNCDFFKENSKYMKLFSKYSHILDFDACRLGKLMIPNNEYAHYLEFGIINITEVGKERGNQLENIIFKIDSNESNPKNDGFNKFLKMMRHRATIRGFCFLRIFMDENRADSLGADARELSQIVHINSKTDLKLCLSSYELRYLFIENLISKFGDYYLKDYRIRRSDNTLFLYIIHNLVSKMKHYHDNILNQFGFYQLDMSIEKGTQDGILSESKYFLQRKKIFSDRYSTDAYKEFFRIKVLYSLYGLDDIPTYKSKTATFVEMSMQNSRFFNELAEQFKIEFEAIKDEVEINDSNEFKVDESVDLI